MSWRDHTKDKARVIRLDLMEAQGEVPQCISRTVYELGRIPGARRRRLRHIDNEKGSRIYFNFKFDVLLK